MGYWFYELLTYRVQDPHPWLYVHVTYISVVTLIVANILYGFLWKKSYFFVTTFHPFVYTIESNRIITGLLVIHWISLKITTTIITSISGQNVCTSSISLCFFFICIVDIYIYVNTTVPLDFPCHKPNTEHPVISRNLFQFLTFMVAKAVKVMCKYCDRVLWCDWKTWPQSFFHSMNKI